MFLKQSICESEREDISKELLRNCWRKSVCLWRIKRYTVQKYQYSFEMENRLLNAISDRKTELAIFLVDNLLDMNCRSDRKLTVEMRTCLIYDIFTLLVKMSEKDSIELKWMLALEQISRNASLEKTKLFFEEIIYEICNETRESVHELREYRLSERVIEYIWSNFTNQNLNVSYIALQFDVTPSYLSTIFRKETGEYVIDVLRKVRINYARSLLEKGMIVKEAAQKSGFLDSSTFFRSFKNYFGISPGQLQRKK